MKRFGTDKDPDEPITVAVNWLTTGKVTITSVLTNATVTATSTRDESASAIISGTSTIDPDAAGDENNGVPALWQKQAIVDGVDGADYVLTFECDTDNAAFPHLVERVVLRCRTDRP